MSMMGGRPRGGREHSVEEACPEEGGVKTQSAWEPSRGGFWSLLDGAHIQQHLWYLVPPGKQLWLLFQPSRVLSSH